MLECNSQPQCKQSRQATLRQSACAPRRQRPAAATAPAPAAASARPRPAPASAPPPALAAAAARSQAGRTTACWRLRACSAAGTRRLGGAAAAAAPSRGSSTRCAAAVVRCCGCALLRLALLPASPKSFPSEHTNWRPPCVMSQTFPGHKHLLQTESGSPLSRPRGSRGTGGSLRDLLPDVEEVRGGFHFVQRACSFALDGGGFGYRLTAYAQRPTHESRTKTTAPRCCPAMRRRPAALSTPPPRCPPASGSCWSRARRSR